MFITDSIILPPEIDKPLFFSPLTDTETANSRNLPHWEQSGKTVFVTFRLADSIPQDKLSVWREGESEWAKHHPQPWDESTQLEHDTLFGTAIEQWLDSGFGSCLMKDEGARHIVEEALLNFDGERYRMYGFVVMPNHVHACFMPLGGYTVSDIVQNWKSFTAKAVNKLLGRRGVFWQKEYFDRYIRNERHFERVLRYIHRNDPSIAWRAWHM